MIVSVILNLVLNWIKAKTSFRYFTFFFFSYFANILIILIFALVLIGIDLMYFFLNFAFHLNYRIKHMKSIMIYQNHVLG